MSAYSPKTQAVLKEIEQFGYGLPKEVLEQVLALDLDKQQQQGASILKLVRDLTAFAPKERGRLRLALVLTSLSQILNFSTYLLAAYALTWLYQVGLNQTPQWQPLLIYSALTALALIVAAWLFRTGSLAAHQATFAILKNLRKHLNEKLLTIPLGYVVDNSLGSIKTILVTRVNQLEDFLAHGLSEVISAMLPPLLAIITLFICDWRLGLATLAGVLVVALGLAINFYHYLPRYALWQGSYNALVARTLEYVRGIPVIKAFLQEDRAYRQFEEAVDYYEHTTLGWWRQSWLGTALIAAAGLVPLLVVLPVSFYLFKQGAIAIGTLGLALALPFSFTARLMYIAMAFELATMASSAYTSLKELLEYPALKRPKTTTPVALAEPAILEFHDVHFSYGNGAPQSSSENANNVSSEKSASSAENANNASSPSRANNANTTLKNAEKEVLKGISFSLPAHSFTALVGPSGSGKSTIAKLIAGFWDPSSGSITYGGKDIKEIPLSQYASHIAYVAQDNYLFDATLLDNIKMANPQATKADLNAAIQAAKVDELVAKLENGLLTKSGEAGLALSGGERQRITLARALLKDAQTIVLDEATAYADPENEAAIQSALNKLVAQKSLLVVAHRLHTIINADQIIVLDQGRIVGKGRHQELLKTCPLYAELWRKYANEEVR